MKLSFRRNQTPGAIPSPCPEQHAVPAWLWRILPAIIAIFIFSVCLLWQHAWPWLGVVRMHPYFSDWIAILAASDAQAAGLDPYSVPSPFDPYARPHVYGPWWLYLHHLGLSMEDSAWMGGLIDIVTIFGASYILGARTPGQAFVAAALIASPPLLMAYERANNDLIIFVILIVAGYGTCRFVQAPLLITAAILKFYPVAALPLLAFRRTFKSAIWGTGIALAVVFALLYFWRDDLKQAVSLMPKPDTIYGFGLSAIPRYILSLPTTPFKIAAVAGVIVGAALIGLATGRCKRRYAAMTGTAATGWFITGGLCWVACYLINTNYPYRAVLLMLPAAGWFNLWQTEPPEEARRYRHLLCAIVIMLWIHSACAHTMSLGTSSSIYVGIFGMGIMQGAAFAVTCVIACALFLLGRKTLAEWRNTPCPVP